LIQDDDGNLWIGTMAGLSRYNGREFKTFSKDDGLAEDWITATLKDKFGNLWYGHWGGGVTIYNFKTKELVNLQLAEIVKYKTITSLYEDKKGNIWIGTLGAGLFSYDSEQSSFTSITEKEGLNSDIVLSITEDEKGTLWCGTANGITIFNSQKVLSELESKNNLENVSEEVKSFCSHITIENGLPNAQVIYLYTAFNGNIWVGTREGIVVFDPTDIYDKNPIVFNTESGLSSTTINHIIEDNEGNFWFSSPDNGITQFIPDSKDSFKGIFKIFNSDKGLNFNKVNTIVQDREGNIWVGTELGLNQYRGERFLIYDDSDGLSHSLVFSVLEDSNGNIWLGTEGGISKLNEDNKSIDGSIFKNYNIEDGLPSNVVYCILEDRTGSLWFGTAGSGIAKLEKGQQKFKIITNENGLAGNVIYSIDSDQSGNIWIGTNEGASFYNLETGSFTNYNGSNGLTGDKAIKVYCDSHGNVWFGIVGGDLVKYDGTNFKSYGEKDGLDSKLLLCMNEDREGNMWFGAYGSGIYKYNGNVFRNYTVKSGLSSGTPFLITCDLNNNLWIGTSLGIDKLDPKTNTFSHYGLQQGFLGIETVQNAECVDSKGNMWFGTIMGVVKYNPNEDKANVQQPITKITNLQISRKFEEFPENNTFEHSQNHLTFHFTGVSLTNPEEVYYQYKLEGFDKDWSPFTKVNYVDYANLNYGHYKFLVKACNNDGLWNAEPSSYEFEILTPYWRTWWFYSLCTFLFALAIYGFVLYRIRIIKIEKKILEEKVELRTHQLSEEKQKLEVAYQHIEEHNRHITASITYAKRIQEAILPTDSLIKKALPNSFVYYQPKDIVSGDFYWFATKKDKTVIAAVDCTGHGVPGAFMSLIGYTLLNQIVIEENILQPSEILSRLDEGVKAALKQSEEGAETMDGMDIALVTIDKKNKEVLFAGALRPLFFKTNGSIEEIKGDKYSIGGHAFLGGTQYKTHKIKVNENDSIYLFSDGIPDQFGGPRNKKLTKRRLREMLADCKIQKMDEQYEWLQKEIEDWQGNYDQTDDIMLIGIKF
ncbi:MAG: SpoIIE family protein phosphatase, partial [Bacteroidia bacterium]|nr:SpoIIE family protein phosphatase [Bacteroidia bacterium]